MTAPAIVGRCAHCGVDIERDETASWWLRRDVYFDPDAVDVDVTGRSCEDGGEHELYVEPTRAERMEARAPIPGYPEEFCDRCGYQAACPDCVGA